MLMYKYPYLENNEYRGRYLYSEIKPFLGKKETVLDVACGYSPMAKFFIEDGHKIIGFDTHKEPIKNNKERFPNQTWVLESYENFNYDGFSIMLILGIVRIPQGDIKFQKWLEQRLDNNYINIIMIEAGELRKNLPRYKIYPKIRSIIEDHSFKLRKNSSYNAKIDVLPNRVYSIYT